MTDLIRSSAPVRSGLSAPTHRLLVTTLPKSGTHLINSILQMMPPLKRVRGIYFNNSLARHPLNLLPSPNAETCLMGVGQPRSIKTLAVRQQLRRLRPGTYGLGHIPYSKTMDRLLRERDFRRVMLIRDPRAVAVSGLHYVLARPDHYFHDSLIGLSTEAERMQAIIRGLSLPNGRQQLGITEQVDLMLPWMDDPDTLTLRFEDLVGSQGSGDDQVQREKIRTLAQFIGYRLDEDDAARIGSEMFGRGKTFRTGQIDGWRSTLNGDLLHELEDNLGDRLARLGYWQR